MIFDLRFLVILLMTLIMPGSLFALPMSELMGTNAPSAPVSYVTNATSRQVIYPFLPQDIRPGEKRAAIVLIHGGGWWAGDPSIFFPAARYFASRGIPAFSIGYRLIKADLSSAPGVPESLEDCRAALRYIRAHAEKYGVDPNRIAVMGDSAGGHLSACLGTMIDPKDASTGVRSSADAMILCNPIVDMTYGRWLRAIQRGEALKNLTATNVPMATPEQQRLAHELSPLFFVSGKTPPTLLMQGLEDTVVSPEQSRQFTAAMKKAGVRCNRVLIPGAHHAFILPYYTATEAQVVKALCRADRFLRSLNYLKGKPTLTVSTVPAWLPKPVIKPSPIPTTSASPQK